MRNRCMNIERIPLGEFKHSVNLEKFSKTNRKLQNPTPYVSVQA